MHTLPCLIIYSPVNFALIYALVCLTACLLLPLCSFSSTPSTTTSTTATRSGTATATASSTGTRTSTGTVNNANLVAWYPLDSNFNDYSGNGLHLTKSGSGDLPIQPTFNQMGVYFDGNTGLRTSATTLLPSGGADRTIIAWAVIPSSGTYVGELVNWGVELDSQMSALKAYYIDLTDASGTRMQAYGNFADASAYTGLSQSSASSRWAMYTLSYKNGAATFYVDTTNVGSGTTVAGITAKPWNTPSTVRLSLGGTGNSTMSGFFKGSLAQVCTSLTRVKQWF